MTAVRWIRTSLVIVGALLMAYAVVGALDGGGIKPVPQTVFLATLLVGHDALFVPAVIAIGAAIGRYVPAPARSLVRVAALASVAITIVALPFVLGRGRRPDDPSALPLNYGRGLAVVLAAVWLVVAVALLVGWWRRRITARADRASVS